MFFGLHLRFLMAKWHAHTRERKNQFNEFADKDIHVAAKPFDCRREGVVFRGGLRLAIDSFGWESLRNPRRACEGVLRRNTPFGLFEFMRAKM